MVYFLLILLLISVIVEGTLTSLPLVLVCLLCLTILERNSWLFLGAFVAGIFLDVFALRPLGGASVFLLCYIFLILLYQRKYEIYSYQFVMVAAFLGSLLFLLMYHVGSIWGQSIISAMLAALLFGIISVKRKAKSEKV